MPKMMRARHNVFGVVDVLDNDFYRKNGWTPVADDTPLTVDEQRKAVNEARRNTPAPAPSAEPVAPDAPAVFDPSERNAEDVVAYLASAGPEERQRVLDLERSGKARKTVLDED